MSAWIVDLFPIGFSRYTTLRISGPESAGRARCRCSRGLYGSTTPANGRPFRRVSQPQTRQEIRLSKCSCPKGIIDAVLTPKASHRHAFDILLECPRGDPTGRSGGDEKP